MKTTLLRLSCLASLLAALSMLTAHAQFLGVDTNGNGISDVYESLYTGSVSGVNPSGDDDADGMSNEDEAAAGTNMRSNVDVLKFTTVVQGVNTVQGTWPTVLGKVYQMQASTNLIGVWINEGAATSGTGGQVSATCPATASRMFMRVQVKDLDTDGDGVTNWEELQAGTNPNVWDSDGDGKSDMDLLKGIVLAPNTVNVTAVENWIREGDAKQGVFRFTRRGGFWPLTVPFGITGSATLNTDYTISNTTGKVTFPAGVTAVTVNVTALADAPLENAETIILTAQAGAGYTVGGSPAATVTIVSQGLLGQYFNFSSSTYNFAPTAGQNFDPAQLGLTRRDTNISFDWSKPAGNPPGTGTGTPSPLIVDDDLWGARWTGFIIPKYTEVYQVTATADRGIKVYLSTTPILGVNTNQLRMDQWTTPSPSTAIAAANLLSSTEVTTRIMEAGRPYYFQVDYRDSATNTDNANIDVRWLSPSQTEQTIPTSALTSDGFIGWTPVITSLPAIVGLRNAPFVYAITATNVPTIFSAEGLPAGLSVNPSTGGISGAITASAGVYFATITAANGGGADVKNLTIYVISSVGNIARQTWTTGFTGTTASDVPVWTAPATTTTLTATEAPANAGDQFGDRMRGYITAPISGNYTFFLTSDENADLYISGTTEPNQVLRRSWVKNGTVPAGNYTTQASQQSITMRMKAGDAYYFEATRRETTGTDHFAIAWQKPGDTVPEIIPAYALSPYSAPDELNNTDTLYLANLSPQAGAVTLGSGSALLRVNAAKTIAYLTFTFANLTGPINNQHIHDARNSPAPAGAILFDVDDAIPDANGRRTWNIIATGLHTAADVVAAIESGNAYLNLHTTAYPSGEIKGFFRPVKGSQTFFPPAAGPAAELTLPANATVRKQDIVRFLQQATFGAREDTDGIAPWDVDSIENVDALGYSAWIDAQLALPKGTDPETLVTQFVPPRILYIDPTNVLPTLIPAGQSTGYNGSGPLANLVRTYYDKFPLSNTGNVGAPLESNDEIPRAWWQAMVKSPDQLRHRVAFALSEIFVVSNDGELDSLARALVHYHDLLYYHGLGNFRTLLEKVTLNPAMGKYLDMLNNKKPNPAIGYIPNENFAREIMQLFTIGLRRLHPDGSLALNSAVLPVDTYDQEDVVGLAHALTGWIQPGNGNDYVTPMIAKASDHDVDDKILFENAVIPATGTATTTTTQTELATSLDLIFQHPNLGPFIVRELIQRMVTANPTPGYIYRVVKAFNDNGSGVRGDMAAVVKTLLLDSEARNQAARSFTSFGHIKEPDIRATQMLRAFKGFSYGEANYGTVNLRGMVTCSPNGNINVAAALPTSTYTRLGNRALYAGDVITLSGQTPSTENGLYIFNGNGAALTPTATGTTVATYSVDLATITTPIPTESYPVIEGLPLGVNSKILLRNQTVAAENGVYVLTSVTAPLTRWANYDEPLEINASRVTVAAYHDPTTLAYSNKTFAQTATVNVVGTDPLIFADSSSTTSGKQAWNMGATSGSTLTQTPLKAATVFNYFEPDYVFLGDTGNNNLVSPEFQLTSETSVVNAANWAYTLARRNGNVTTAQTRGQGFSYDSVIYGDIKMDLTTERALAGTADQLVDRVALLLMPGQMSSTLRTILINHLNTLASSTNDNKMDRVAELLYFISMSPEFALQN